MHADVVSKKDPQYTENTEQAVHPDLTKMQGMLGAKMPYKELRKH
jgi:hypothetical protein